MARTCTRFPAAERRQQHARRKDKARRLTQVPWAESRRPLAQTTALPHRMGPERPMLAMTVKVFFQEEEDDDDDEEEERIIDNQQVNLLTIKR